MMETIIIKSSQSFQIDSELKLIKNVQRNKTTYKGKAALLGPARLSNSPDSGPKPHRLYLKSKENSENH